MKACLARLAIVMLVAQCAACASYRPNYAQANSTANATDATDATFSPQSNRSPQSRFNTEGRLSVRYTQEGKDQQITGLFTWQQESDLTRIMLSSPTGQALAEITVTPTLASVTQAGQTLSTASIDQLTSQLLGWPLPVAGLRDWLQGFALDERGMRFVASSKQESVITPDGWRIRYASWHDENHPKRIDLERHIDAQGGDVFIRIIIDPP